MTETHAQRTSGAAGDTAGDRAAPQRSDWRSRLQSKLASAAEEHRANANPEQAVRKTGTRQPRRARLHLTRVDPWSVMKTAFLLSIALAVVTIISVTIVWSVLGAAGVWDSINSSIKSVLGEESAGFDVENYVGLSRILGFTILVSIIDVILVTAIATLGAFLYNMAAALLGGIEVTLAEDSH